MLCALPRLTNEVPELLLVLFWIYEHPREEEVDPLAWVKRFELEFLYNDGWDLVRQALSQSRLCLTGYELPSHPQKQDLGDVPALLGL